MDEKEKLIVNNLIEDKKSLWTVVIVLMGGIIGLIASLNGVTSAFQITFRGIMCGIGVIIWYFMVMNLISVTNQIKERLRK
ncbi:MAG: hypothetical protein PHC64_01575 [Candidatus Gastranaerophilales bacterium]|nr:hypothetical protein [Candidatus Gastranaerophilales bacterium]